MRHALGLVVAAAFASLSCGDGAGSPCPGGVVAGGYFVSGPSDAERLDSCTTITFDLHILHEYGEDAWEAELRTLAVVEGGVYVQNNGGLTRVSLPALRVVGGPVLVDAAEVLSSFELPALTSVGGDLLVRTAPALATLSLPLTYVGGDVGILDNDVLATLDLPALEAIGGGLGIGAWHDEIGDNPALQGLDLPALSWVGDRVEILGTSLASVNLPALVFVEQYLQIDPGWLENSLPLTALGLPALEGVGSNFSVGGTLLTRLDLPRLTSAGRVSLWGNGALTSADLPALVFSEGDFAIVNNDALPALGLPLLASVGDGFDVHGNDSLAGLDFPRLASVGGPFSIFENESLPTCAAESLRDQILDEGFQGEIDIHGNDDAGVCP